MQTFDQKRALLEQIVEQLELPDSAYQKAAKRYEDLGEFISDASSECAFAAPHIFPQGSFRLGTAIRPLDESEQYDLDLACSLTEGIWASTHSQADVKRLVGKDLAAYRGARGILAPVQSKHRCWRLEYQDDLSFHIDVVPCIPSDESVRNLYRERMVSSGLQRAIANDVSMLAVNITDDREPAFEKIDPNWPVSNPEGYAKWFEYRMNVGLDLMALEKRAQIEKLPTWARKTPLQRVIQLLKRHRDNMFASDPDVKPVSIIITTIAAREYDGSSDLVTVLEKVVNALVAFAQRNESFCPNPVNPAENFADRWTMPRYAHLNLRENFYNWALQLQADFDAITSSTNAARIGNLVYERTAVRLGADSIAKSLGLVAAAPAAMPRHVNVDDSQPWRADDHF
jgi:hypothetical protein